MKKQIQQKYIVSFSEQESGYYTDEENEYTGDCVRTVTVMSDTWENSFSKARGKFYEQHPDANRIYNFTSEQQQ